MKTWLERLASLKLAVALLLVLAAALAAGTVVELRAGTEAAARTVYGALYFRALLALLAMNVVAALATRLPWTDRAELPRFLRLRASAAQSRADLRQRRSMPRQPSGIG